MLFDIFYTQNLKSWRLLGKMHRDGFRSVPLSSKPKAINSHNGKITSITDYGIIC
jgi:hypothetical protein